MRTCVENLASTLLGCVVMLTALGCGSSPVVPESYEQYNAKDGSFQCDCPSGWEVKGGGRGGYYSASFKSGSAKIKVSADLAGSLMGDIAKSMGQIGGIGDQMGDFGEMDEDLSPVAQVHAMGKEEMAEEISNYSEQEPEVVQSNLGEGRRSEFSASGAFAGKLHGYRATFLARDRRVMAVCSCRGGDWERLKPVFEKVIDSFRAGVAEI